MTPLLMGESPLFIVNIKRRALRAIPDLHASQRVEIRRLFSELEHDPVPYHSYEVATLEGAQNAYRVRLGGSRVVYIVDWKSSVITVTRIEPRGRAYKGL